MLFMKVMKFIFELGMLSLELQWLWRLYRKLDILGIELWKLLRSYDILGVLGLELWKLLGLDGMLGVLGIELSNFGKLGCHLGWDYRNKIQIR